MWLEIYLSYRFQVSQPCASVSELPAALRRPQKKHALDFGTPFGRTLGTLWLPLGSLWPSFGVPLAILGHLWNPFGAAWATLWRLLDFVEHWTSFSEQMCRFLDTVVQNQASPDSHPVPAVLPVSGKVVSGTAAPTPCPHAPGARITVV